MTARGVAGAADAVAALPGTFARTRTRLADLVAIPGISANAFPREEVRRSAAAVAETLVDYGMHGVRLLETAGHPAVYGELRVSADAPTVLVYGHHDVQPAGRMERWTSPPFQAETRDGRMFGRGTADDKGGFLAYLGAASTCGSRCTPLQSAAAHRGRRGDRIAASRGAARRASRALRLRFHRALRHAELRDRRAGAHVPAPRQLHRGRRGALPRASAAQRPGRRPRARPDDDSLFAPRASPARDGTLAIPGLDDCVRTDAAQLEALRALPFDGDRLRRDFGLAGRVTLLSESWEAVWTRPSLTITAIESVPVAQAANQIADAARARLSLRTVREIDTRAAGEMLVRALQTNVPHDAVVTATVAGGPSWWEADPRHAVFAAARRALARGFGEEAVMIGSGGSIGFVKPFADLSGDVPPILTGVQDPRSNAHSENESLDLGDWQKAMAGAVYLFHELAAFRSGAAA